MKKYLSVLALCLLLFVCASCGKEKEEKSSEYFIACVNEAETRIEQVDYKPKQKEPQLEELLKKIKEIPKENDKKPLLPAGVKILDCKMDGKVLKVNVNSAYLKQKKSREILSRAGLVRTFVQLPKVKKVEIFVEGETLRNSTGEAVGALDQESFVENSGKEINAYHAADLVLYYTDESGEKLVREKRQRYYSSNVPVERVVVEELIKGPGVEGNFRTLPENLKILGITVSEGICYLNFTQEFLDSTLPVAEKIPIYSLANSLIETCGVQSIQISVNGENKKTFRETMRLDQFYQQYREEKEGA